MTTTPWSQPWARLRLGDDTFVVKRLDVQEWVSWPFRAWAYVVLEPHRQPPARAACIGMGASLEWGNGDWGRRCRGGVVAHLRGGDCAETERPYFEVVIEPRLTRLRHEHATRLFKNVEPGELVERLLSEAGYPSEAIDWLAGEQRRRSQILQARESGFELLQRLLARCGIYYAWDDDPGERLRFVEAARALSRRQEPVLVSQDANPEPRRYGLDRHAVVRKLWEPPTRLIAERLIEDADRLELVRRQRADVASYGFRASGPQADLFAGQCVRLERGGAGRGQYTFGHEGWYLLTTTHHRLNMDSSGERVPGGYRLDLQAVPEWVGSKALPYRPPEPANRPRPLVMSAEVVSDSSRRPDSFAKGGARVRVAEGDERSLELPRVAAFNGNTSSRSGWYTPLHNGNRVLVSCLDHDPDAVVVVGVLPTAGNRQSAATSRGRDGSYLSKMGQGIRVTGAGGREGDGTRLILRSPDAASRLEFLVSEDDHPDLVQLVCEKGALDLDSGGQLTERVGGARNDDVAGSERVTVGGNASARSGGNAYVRARESVALAGREGLRLDAGGALQVRSAGTMRLEGGSGTRIRIAGGDSVWQTLNGDLQLQAARSVRLRSRQGSITVTNAARSGGLAVEADGITSLWGETVTINAGGTLCLDGPVDYQTGGPEPREPVVVEPEPLIETAKITADGASNIEPMDW